MKKTTRKWALCHRGTVGSSVTLLPGGKHRAKSCFLTAVTTLTLSLWLIPSSHFVREPFLLPPLNGPIVVVYVIF